MLRILHFADAHIDIAAHGRHDPQSGLPLRVLDFLKALDTIIDTAISERVDLVLFAGDAYKDRTPAPTFQREWGRRIMRLSSAGIPTLMLVGNHDLSPAVGRANALQEFDTLQVPHLRVIQRPSFLHPSDLEGLPLQVLALPWVSRSGLMASLQANNLDATQIYGELETRLSELVRQWLDHIDPSLPVILTAHASVQGAKYGAERSVMLGGDLVLSGSLVKDPRLDYVALGHIHKSQDVNSGAHPPVIYPGSIERVDFGEAADDKFFVIANINRGKTTIEWHQLEGRRFIDQTARITSEAMFQSLANILPSQEVLKDAIARLVVEYPRQWDPLLDEPALRRYAEGAFEFHLVRRPQLEARLRLPNDQTISSLTPLELLEKYLEVVNTNPDEIIVLEKLAEEIVTGSQPLIENP